MVDVLRRYSFSTVLLYLDYDPHLQMLSLSCLSVRVCVYWHDHGLPEVSPTWLKNRHGT